jgi:hypothetical protein
MKDYAKVYKVDKKTLKPFNYLIPIMNHDLTKILKSLEKACNVGDFVELRDNKFYKRVRGGFKEVTQEEMALLIAAQLGGEVKDE